MARSTGSGRMTNEARPWSPPQCRAAGQRRLLPDPALWRKILLSPQPIRFLDIITKGKWGVIGSVQFVDGDISEPSDTTEHLIERVKSGDTKAFERLISEHYRFIYKTAFRWLGHKSDAEDVTQAVCIRLVDSITRFDGRSKFTSWLYSVTLNAVRDLQRSHKRRGNHIQAVSYVARKEIDASQEDDLRVNDIWRVVRQLPEKQRDAVMLVFGEQLSQAEAAVIMGCKEVTVSWHIHNARKSLKDLL